VNQENSKLVTGQGNWIGTGSTKTNAVLGIYYPNVRIPSTATITSAKLVFMAPTDQWISINTTVGLDGSSSPLPFSSTALPAQRTLMFGTTYSNNIKWTANTRNANSTIDLTSQIKQLQTLAGRAETAPVAVLIKSNGGNYSRKFFYNSPKEKAPQLIITYNESSTTPVSPSPLPTSIPSPTTMVMPSGTTMPSGTAPTMAPMSGDESMAMMAWRVGGKNSPNPKYDKCDDGTDIVAVHNMYYVVAYDGKKYPTWHPTVVDNPVTKIGKCYFGHDHGSNPQKYAFWDEVYKHFGMDSNGDGTISPLIISSTGQITPGDRAGIPFGIANEHMDQYYNKEGRDSYFVRHEDHVGHKIEVVNNEADMNGTYDGNETKTTHQMTQLAGTQGLNIPYYKMGTNEYFPTGVACTHLHKFHQGTHSADAVRNNLHEVIFHSTCQSVNTAGINAPAYYPNNKVILTGMMSFGNPGGYKRFCGNNRSTLVCPDGYNSDGSCKITDPLISKLPDAIYSDTIGRNMVDRTCLESLGKEGSSNFYFNPYEIWQGDLRIQTSSGKMLAEHGRQWDVLDPIRYVDPKATNGMSYNQTECGRGGLLFRRTAGCTIDTVPAWDSPQAEFKGLHRTTYFGRNRVSNNGGQQIWWTDPLGGNAVNAQFASGLKQYIAPVEADIEKVQYRIQTLKGTPGQNYFLNDRAMQRIFNNGNGTVHAPN
jgi:hypothetical protein